MAYGFLLLLASVRTISYHKWLVYIKLYYLQIFLQSLLTNFMHISYYYDVSYVIYIRHTEV